jgi:hypothetical protein
MRHHDDTNLFLLPNLSAADEGEGGGSIITSVRQMTELIDFMDRGLRCWARFRLDSSDPCWLRVSPSGVLVKRSRLGLLGAKLYSETHPGAVAMTAAALGVLYPKPMTPRGMRDPFLIAFSNAILHCSTVQEVEESLNGAVRYRS